MTKPHSVHQSLQHLHHLWATAVEPAPNLTDPIECQHARLLNSLMVAFLPLALLVLVVQVLIVPFEELSQSNTIKAIMMGIALVTLIYRLNRTGHYRFTIYFALSAGLIAILANALASAPPHLEIAYLIMLPLLGTLLLSWHETLFLAAGTIICLIGFDWIMQHEIPFEIIKDLLTFTIFTEAFILLVSRQRDRLEADRQRLVAERDRNLLLKQLIRNLSHDFRTPLAVITTSLYLLRRIDDPQQQQEKLDQIEKQAERLTRFIDDILTISHLEQIADPSLQLVDINALVKLATDRFCKDLELKPIALRFELDPQLPRVLGNQDDLERALTILVENAVRYTQAGAITLRTFQHSDMLVFEVSDTGIGIAEADLPYIFDRFFRADSARSAHTGGTGLGLAIARRVMELHGGQIEVESAVGQGSHFRVQLPVRKGRD